MPEPFDEYVDQYTFGGGAFGVALNFSRSSPKPGAPGSIPPNEDVGAIRMSLEHFKVMAYLMRKQVLEIESQLGIEIPLSYQLQNALKIAPEDWQQFWRSAS